MSGMTQKDRPRVMVDLVVTHYDEPWEDGKGLFEMLAMQRGVNMEDFRVLIVQDGSEGALDWKMRMRRYPFQVAVKTIPHGGVSRARNVGIGVSDAEWIMFCDFDDMFSSVHSLRRYFENMRDEYDMVFGHVFGENMSGGGYHLDSYMNNDTFIHGKMFRREWLIRGNLWFEEGVAFGEDSVFCHVMRMELNPARQKEIPEYLFFHTWREGSACRNMENNFRNADGAFKGRKALIREYHDRGRTKNYMGTVIKTVFDYYYALQYSGYPERAYFERDFMEFWKKYSDVFYFAERDLFAYEKDISHTEACHKGFLTTESMTVWEWIAKMEKKYGPEIDDTPKKKTRYPKIAVFHTTRNRYEEMIACAKALVMHSGVEKVWFVTEDDEVGKEELPEFIGIRNVSGQAYIRKDSPNYDCGWTWMVMMRAAFTKIFPEYEVILSIDVDAVAEHNIDRIWDTDLTDKYYAAAVEPRTSEKQGQMWTNMGVCLLNLAKLREDGMDDRILEELNTVKHTFTEQDVFNLFCAGKVAEIPSEYNSCAYTRGSEVSRILHFAGSGGQSHALIEKYKAYEWDDVLERRNRG